MSENFKSSAKELIRGVWAKSIIEFLSNDIKSKLVYLGLPGEEARDIEEWIDFLDKVFAFQNDDDRYPLALEKLINKLDVLEQQGKLQTYNVFNGYIERVVTEGYDESDSRFELNDVITLYNLDFCNQIDFPIEVQITEPPYVKEVFKFDAIESLLNIQKSLDSQSNRFVLYLTIHCSYKDRRTVELLNTDKYRDYLAPKNKLLKGKGHFKNAYALRKLVLRSLTHKFKLSGFESQILPTIYYEGDKGTPMLFFTIIGKKGAHVSDEELESQLVTQLNTKFISVSESSFINLEIDSILEEDNEILDPVSFFQDTDFYKYIWQNENSQNTLNRTKL